jgi:uncharacterized membrane protein YfhO
MQHPTSELPGPTEGADAPPGPRAPGDRLRSLAGLLGCAAALILCEALVFRYLFQYGVSNIWLVDGASQHFPALVYFREWVTAILSGHGAGYGFWSWRLGLGADTLTSLSYYLADPFALISLAFPPRMIEYVYEGIFFLKILCGGLAGYFYLRTMKSTRLAAIAGVLVYAFTTFTLDLTLEHPFFLNAMILLPLVLVGTEWVLTRKRWYLLAGALFVGAATNFFIFWWVVIVGVLYAVARWFELTDPGERLRRVLRDGLGVARWYVLAAVLAAGMLVPLGIAVIGSSRSASEYTTTLFSAGRSYLALSVALISIRTAPAYFYAGFSVIGLLAALIVFLRPGRTALKTMLSAFGVFLVFPVFGTLFNGLSFPSYRFYFMGGLFLAAAVAALLSDKAPLTGRETLVSGGALAAFAAWEIYATMVLRDPLPVTLIPLALGGLAWALLAAQGALARRRMSASAEAGGRSDPMGPVTRAGIVALIIAGIAAAGVMSYDSHYSITLKSYMRLGSALEAYLRDPGERLPSLPTSGLQRFDKQQGVLGNDVGVSYNNDPLVQRYAGLDFYYSIMSLGLHTYTKGLDIRTQRLAWDFEGFDDRAALDALNGVRYYVAPPVGERFAPYGFSRVGALGRDVVYENRQPLPIGYVYHAAVRPSVYAAMPPLEKQQSLLQAVVVADDVAPGVPRAVPAAETIDVPHTLISGRGISWDSSARRIRVSVRDAAARLTFAPVPGAELYVQMTGIKFRSPGRFLPSVGTVGAGKSHRFLSPQMEGYAWGDDTLLVNLGYFANGVGSARLSITDTDVVTYDSLKVIAVPMAKFDGRVRALAAEGMRDVKVGTDTLSGTVTARSDGILFLSIPYSSGWRATVDGVPTPIVTANVGFSAIAVTSGTHSVRLDYATPGLRTGVLISLLTLFLTGVLVVLTERRIRSRRRPAEAPGHGASSETIPTEAG